MGRAGRSRWLVRQGNEPDCIRQRKIEILLSYWLWNVLSKFLSRVYFLPLGFTLQKGLTVGDSFFFPNDDPLSTSKMNYRLACLRITPYPPAPSTILTLYPLKIISISLMERFFLASRNRLAGCDRLWGSITLPAYLFSLNTTIRHVRLELLRTKVRMFYATTTNLDSVALMNRS